MASSTRPALISSEERICTLLREIFAKVLGVSATDFAPGISFLELGADSLALLEASQRVEEKFGVNIPFRTLLEELTTVESVAKHIGEEVTCSQPEAEMKEEIRPAIARPAAPPRAEEVALQPEMLAVSTASNCIVPTESNHAPKDAPVVSALERVAQRQLQIMAQQLELLRSCGPDRKFAANSDIIGAQMDPVLMAGTRSSVKVNEASCCPPAQAVHKAENRTGDNPDEPYVAYEPIQTSSSKLESPSQQAFLQGLIARISAKTAESKRRSHEHRQFLADNRWSAGFRILWKEMFYPIMVERAAGSRFWDVDGNEYVDLTMGFGTLLFGHSPTFVISALHDRLDKGVGLGPQSGLAGDVARLLCELTGMERATFCNSGTEAVMIALRLARTVTMRNKIALFAGSYHGTFDQVLVRPVEGPDGSLHSVPMARGIDPTFVQNVILLKYNSKDAVEQVRKCSHELAAVLVEPSQSRRPDIETRQFLHELRAVTEKAGIALIFDEVVTGFRTHPGGAQALYGVNADLVTYGKAVGAGLPIGVVAGKAAYLNAVDGGTWRYGDSSYPAAETTFTAGTFFKHPLVMEAAWAVLNHIRSNGPSLQRSLNEKTAELVSRLQAIFTKEQLPITVVNFGSLFRILPRQRFPMLELLYYSLLERGVYIWEGRVCYLSTAHTAEDCDHIVSAVQQSVDELLASGCWPSAQNSGIMAAHQSTDERQKASGDSNTVAGPSAEQLSGTRVLPLTEAQRELWVSSNLGRHGSGSHQLSAVFHFSGSLEVDVLQHALNHVIKRHDSLRTGFSADASQQRIAPSVTIELPIVDLSPSSPEERDRAVQEWITTERDRPFDLERPPLLRAFLCRLATDDYYFILTVHHLIADGWSLGILLHELAELYSASRQGRPDRLRHPVQFSEYMDWLARQEQASSVKDEIYWTSVFKNGVPRLGLAGSPKDPVSSTQSAACHILNLDQELVRQLRSLGREMGSTFFTTLFAGLASLLSRITGQKDLVVGIASAGQASAGMHELIGYCLNPLLIHAHVENDLTVRDHVACVRRTVSEAQEHFSYSYRKLLQRLNPSASSTLRTPVEVVFNLDNYVPEEIPFHGTHLEVIAAPVQSVNFPLCVMATDMGKTVEVRFEYDRHRFEEKTVAQIAENYQLLLREMLAHPEQSLSRLSLPDYSADQQSSVLAEQITAHRSVPQGINSLLLDPKLIEEREYWVKRLGRVRERGQLWAEGERVKASGRARCQGEMGGEVWQGMLRLSEGGGLLLYTTVVAAMKICLARYSGSEVVVVGSPARRGKGKGKGNGRCAWGNVVAVVDEVSGGERVQELLQQVKGSLLEAYGRQQYGLERLVKELGLKGAEDLFDVVVSFAELHEEVEGVEGDVEGSVVVRLERKEAGLSWAAEYEEREGGEERVRGLLRHMETVLEQMVAQPERRVGELRLLGEEEREQVLVEWNRTEMEYGQEQCIHELFEQQAERRPEAVAVEFGEQRLSYGELERRSNELAQYLREQGVGPEAVVGIWQERSLEMVESVLGVLKAGGGYLPVDEECPQERVKWMLEEAGVKVLLTEEERGEGLEQAGWRGRRLDVRGKREEIGKRSGERVGSGVCAANLAYVIYTSGSTGRPKGVQIQHGGIVNLVEATRAPFRVGPEDRILQFTSLSFDVSVWEMWLALSTGARLVLGKKETMRSVAELRDLMQRQRVTVAGLPPSLVAVLEEVDLPDLRKLGVGGDRVPAQVAKRWSKGRLFLNGYGVTEQTVIATLQECQGEHEQDPPIGRPIGNTQVYVLDEAMEPAAIGVAGEICLAGAGLGRGYLRRPDLTAEGYVPNPFGRKSGERLYRTGDLGRWRKDGAVEFIGRKDDQVKVRGYRVELGEIEVALRRLNGVMDAAAMVREAEGGDKRLVGYVVWQGLEAYSGQHLREQLKQTLPEYMVPAALVKMEQMPLNSSGKIDRTALPAPEFKQEAAVYVQPLTRAERQLAEVWARILRVSQVGLNDNFFELGGDSILAIQAMAKAREAGFRFSLADLFEHPTVAELTVLRETATSIDAEQGLVGGPVQLTPIQRWFTTLDFPDPHHFNHAVFFEVMTRLEPSLVRLATEVLLKHHDALRMRFSVHPDGWQQTCSDAIEPAPFSHIDVSGLSGQAQTLAIETKAAELQQSLNLADGPLVRAILFDLGDEKNNRLLILVHHLIVDLVSWHILLGDFWTAYQQLKASETVQLQSKTTSFQRWAQRLVEYANSGELHGELPYWTNEDRRQAVSLPVDNLSGENRMGSSTHITRTLSQDETEELVRRAGKHYNVQPSDLLLAAMLRGFAQWSGNPSLLVDIELNGRAPLFPDVDLSRTVGWFTCMVPVLFKCPAASDPVQALRHVQQQMRGIPNNGIGYGLMRYVSADKEISSRMRSLPNPQVSFNYFGKMDQMFAGQSLFQPAPENKGATESSRAQRPHLIDLNGMIQSKSLRVLFGYNEAIHRTETITRLADLIWNALRSYLNDQRTPDNAYTTVDFPMAALSQKELNRLLHQIQIGDD